MKNFFPSYLNLDLRVFFQLEKAYILSEMFISIKGIPVKPAKDEPLKIDDKKKISRGQFSLYRSLCMSVYGAVVLGWFVSQWFQFLNNLIPRDGITIGRVILKVFINQLIMSPFLNSLFFGYVIFTRDFTSTLTQKYTLLNKKLQVDLLPTIARPCVYWSIVHLYNFLILPTKYQLLYTNSAFLLWTTYLSLVGYRSVK